MAAPTTTTGLTWDDLLAFGEDGVRREIIDGVLHVSPAPTYRHQQVVARLCAALVPYVDEHGGSVAAGPNTWFAEDGVVEPDIVLLRAENLDRIQGLRVVGPPDLVIELSSPSTRAYDLGAKRALYEAHGVGEYWFVDLEVDRIEAYRLDGQRYSQPALYGRGDTLTSPHLPELRLNVDAALGPRA